MLCFCLKQDLKKSVTASIWLFCLFFKLPFFYFLFFKFLFFTSFSFLLLLYFLFTFQVLCTLLSKSYFIFFSFSKLLPLSDTIWSESTFYFTAYLFHSMVKSFKQILDKSKLVLNNPVNLRQTKLDKSKLVLNIPVNLRHTT